MPNALAIPVPDEQAPAVTALVYPGLIERSSGRNGIERIEDFVDWYQREFPDAAELPPGRIRLVLVGLGVDERVRRIVNHLAKAGLDIQALTFQAFRSASQTLLARKVESVEPSSRAASASSGQKVINQQQLEAFAQQQGVAELLDQAADFVSSHLTGYRWPGKKAFTFNMSERTDDGRPRQLAYASLTVDTRAKGRLILAFPRRAVDAAPDVVLRALTEMRGAERTSSDREAVRVPITAKEWPTLQQPLTVLLDAIFAGWKEKVRRQSIEDLGEGKVSHVAP